MKRGACVGLAALVVAAGCGGGQDRLSKGDYEAKLQSALRTSFRGASSGALHDIGSAPGQLERIATAFHGIAKSLSDVRAPANVQPINDHLVHGASTVARTLDALTDTITATPDLSKRERLLAGFDAAHIAGLGEFDAATAALRARGYRLSWNAGT